MSSDKIELESYIQEKIKTAYTHDRMAKELRMEKISPNTWEEIKQFFERSGFGQPTEYQVRKDHPQDFMREGIGTIILSDDPQKRGEFETAIHAADKDILETLKFYLISASTSIETGGRKFIIAVGNANRDLAYTIRDYLKYIWSDKVKVDIVTKPQDRVYGQNIYIYYYLDVKTSSRELMGLLMENQKTERAR